VGVVRMWIAISLHRQESVAEGYDENEIVPSTFTVQLYLDSRLNV